jgi:hypothetical protein
VPAVDARRHALTPCDRAPALPDPHYERTMVTEDVPAHLDDSGIPERNIERLSRVDPPTALINLNLQRHLYEQSRR